MIQTNDKYPTRKGNRYEMIDRDANDLTWLMPLYHSTYKEKGYYIIKDFFTPEFIAAIKAESEKIFNGKIKCYTNMEPNINQVRSALNIHTMPVFKEALNRRLITIAKKFCNDDVYIHQSRINYKSGKESNGWAWHSDFETWHSKDGMPDMNCVTAVIALDDNTIENGCINFIPKSHTKFIGCPSIGDVLPENEFSEQKEGVPSDEAIDYICKELNTKPKPIECKSGDLILFDCNLLHGSGANTTDDKRANMYLVFNAVSNSLVNPFSGSEHRPKEMGALDVIKL